MPIQSIDPPQTPHPQPQQPRVAQTQPPMVYVYEQQRWEYKVLLKSADDDAAPSEAELNALGRSGWELIGVTLMPPNVRFYFKRPHR